MEVAIVRGKRPSQIPPCQLLTARRFQRALDLLRQASFYSEQTSTDRWEFAVNIQELRRYGISENDLRLLMRLEYLLHACETTADGAIGRRFRHTRELSFSDRSCFVLTATGINALLGRPSASLPGGQPISSIIKISPASRSIQPQAIPSWNRSHRILMLNGQLVRRFKRHAVNQELVLTAFQEDGWSTRIFDPLPPLASEDNKRRLSDTIKCLNRGQANQIIRFRGDGTGEGVTWEPHT